MALLSGVLPCFAEDTEIPFSLMFGTKMTRKHEIPPAVLFLLCYNKKDGPPKNE